MGTGPRRRWEVLPLAPPEIFKELSAYPPLVAQLLFNRGVTSVDEAQVFLSPPTPAPSMAEDLPGARAAVNRIVRAVKEGERIAIFGDFDADGVTSTALLTEALRGLGAHPIVYIPDRVAEGHGLNLAAVQWLHEQGARLIITADCGVTSNAEVAAAADLGIDTIITDHHTPPDLLPDAAAVVNPKLPGGSDALVVLASVGVAYKLTEALYAEMGLPMDESLLELVALGTVADVAPLVGENRWMVSRGLEMLNESQRPGIRALIKVSGSEPGYVNAETIAFQLGPRINAPGRIDHAGASFELLTAGTSEEAQALAAVLEQRNQERRGQTEEILEQSMEAAAAKVEDGRLIFLDDAAYPPGVVGLAAGKLVERWYRPAIVCNVGDTEVKGSCRSIPEFDMIQALRRFDGLFTRYGGHAQAAGFTIPRDKLPALREGLMAYAAEALAETDLSPRVVIDAQVRLERINGEVIRGLRQLEPYGSGNQPPTFLTRGADVQRVRPMGGNGEHLRLTIKAAGVAWDGVAFNLARDLTAHLPGRVDLVYTMTVDSWKGRRRLRLNVLDLQPTDRSPDR
ncbi:MAG: single-stranded-DNA-specific exonuclease RecJ [Chloroflexi bacterium]|nr:single-stranded-DNA-specific exonuclease RecJ [Chloroflexota bacterium]